MDDNGFSKCCPSGNSILDLSDININPNQVYRGARLSRAEVKKLTDDFFKKEEKSAKGSV